MAIVKPPPPGPDDESTLVFVLGAGCSADCGAPVMRQFMRTARELRRAGPARFEHSYRVALDHYYVECVRNSYVLDRHWDNIEELFTQAHLRKLLYDDVTPFNTLRSVIWDVYRRYPEGGGYGYVPFSDNILRMAINRFKTPTGQKALRPVVITMNYDVNLESSLIGASLKSDTLDAQLAVCYGSGIAWSNSRFRCATDATKRTVSFSGGIHSKHISVLLPIEVIKLHGSVNWFVDTKGRRVAKQELANDARMPRFEFQGEEFVDALAETETLNMGTPDGKREGLTPMIVPPMLGKTDEMHKMIREEWTSSVGAIARAREIVFMGYSFPETDLSMNRLLAEGLRQNSTLDNVCIVNNSADAEWWDRVEKMFTRAWWKNSVDCFRMSFLQAAEKIWTSTESLIARALSQ